MKIFLRLAFAAILMAMTPLLASASSGSCGGRTNWTYENGTLTISGTGATSDFSTSSPGWYDLKSEIKRVVIEPGITYIGCDAFRNYLIESVSFPEGLIQIGDHAFAGNPLTTLNLPESLEIIGNSPNIEDRYSGGTFENCQELTEVTLPENLKFIGRVTFGNCIRLERVNWNAKQCKRENFSAIPSLNQESVFMGSPVQIVNFGPLVISIPQYLFFDINSLVEVNTCGTIEFVGAWAFANTGWMKAPEKDYEKVIYIDNAAYAFKVDNTRHDDIVIDIRPGTKSITNGIFENITRLEKITIPESVTKIGSSAFFGCKSLWKVNWNPIKLDNTSGYNGEYLFQNTGLTNINFGPNVQELPGWLLYECEGITCLELPESLQRIGRSAIRSCSGLTSIRIPDNVEYIDVDAFYNCINLEKITIGKYVKTIGMSAFSGLPALKTIEWNAIEAETQDIPFPEPYSLIDFIIGNDVRRVPEKVCYGASSLKNVVLGESLEEIPTYAFYGCKNLEYINLPNSLVTIHNYAFFGTSLTELVIPVNVKNIEGFDAFGGGVPLKNIFFISTSTPSFYYSCFPKTISFYVPDYDKYSVDKYHEYASLYKSYAIADKNRFTDDDTDFSVNFTCNIPDYTMEIINMPELSHEVGEHTATVEAKFSGTCEFTVPFIYNYKVDAGANVSAPCDSIKLQIIGRYNLYGLPVDENYNGVTIIRYSDGSAKKEIKNPTTKTLQSY